MSGFKQGWKRGYHCMNCGKVIRVSIFKGGDWCSERCRKVLEKGPSTTPYRKRA